MKFKLVASALLMPISKPDFSFELSHLQAGAKIIAGVDEAGRGPWAGPVVAGAVILDLDNYPVGLNDSKKLSAAKREILFEQLQDCARIGVGIVDVDEIDQINILQATMKAMAQAVRALPGKVEVALIDGNRAPDLSCRCQTIKKGDALSLSIAAASIIAKVTRDRMMKQLDETFPGYQFSRHKGYGTAIHAAALEKLGVCPQHRKSFAPIRAILAGSK
jgi:ribonuclease HII